MIDLVKKDCCSDRLIHTYDNLFSYHERRKFFMFVRNSKYLCVGKDNVLMTVHDGMQIYSSYSIQDAENMGFLKSEPIKKLYTLYDLRDEDIHQIRINLTTNSEKNHIHTDPTGITLMYYVNLEWKVEWGGHTLFMDDEVKNARYTCIYEPGKVVLFDGSIPHMIMTPSSLCPFHRYSLVIQYKKGK